MSVVEWLEQLGGVAPRATLVALTSRTRVDRAVAAGDVVRVGRRLALAGLEDARALAAQAGGALCLASAATAHGWAVKTVPKRHQVVLARGRRVPAPLRGRIEVHRVSVAPDRVVDGVTDEHTTLAMCLRMLPWDEALAVADSARRAGVPGSTLLAIAEGARGPGSPRMRRVAQEATPLAANPFESVLRSIALDVPGLSVRPQVVIREPQGSARPDLVDERLRIVLEADSFEWHGSRMALARDARRYNLLTINGWLVLRFAWEDVMHDPDHVREVLLTVVPLARMLTEVPSRARKAA